MGLNRVAGWRQLLLLVFLASGAAAASLEADFAEQPEIAARAPRRIVFNQRDLAACLSDVSATTCVLQGVPLQRCSSTDMYMWTCCLTQPLAPACRLVCDALLLPQHPSRWIMLPGVHSLRPQMAQQ